MNNHTKTMLTPNDPISSPNNGWSVTIEGAGPEIRESSFSAFIAAVGVRLRANGMDQHGWMEKAVDLRCRQRPEIGCIDKDINMRDVTVDDFKRFIRTMWEAHQAGARPVSDEEQDRRAAICLTCPMRGYVNCMGGCNQLSQILTEMTIHGRARDIPQLHRNSCMVCGCELSSLIMFPLDVLHSVDEKLNFRTTEYPDHCWKLDGTKPPPITPLQPQKPTDQESSSAQPEP